jgi:hypothetical protein
MADTVSDGRFDFWQRYFNWLSWLFCGVFLHKQQELLRAFDSLELK